MKIFIFLLVFLFSVVSFAGPCEEQVFSAGGVFIAFVKEKGGKKAEQKHITPQWMEEIKKSSSNWNYHEATLFLPVLVGKIGITKAIERITKNYDALENIDLKDFTKKLTFYDAISPEIARHSLSYSFKGFEVQNDLHKTAKSKDIKNTYNLIKNYIGITGAIDLLMTEPSIYKQAHHQKMKEVMMFVEQYTRAHTVKTPLEQRLSTIDPPIQLIELQRAINHFHFNIFGATPALTNKMDKLRYTAFRNQIINIFLALSKSNLSNLEPIVRALETYISPQEVSEIMLNHPEIFTAKAIHVSKTLVILKGVLKLKKESVSKIHNIVAQTKNRTDISENEKAQIYIQANKTIKLIQAMQNTDNLNTAIANIIKEHTKAFLTAYPGLLLKTITYVTTQLKQNIIYLMTTKTNGQNDFNGYLLAMDPARLQTVEKTLTPYFNKEEVINIITQYFGEISQIDHIHFEKLITLLEPYLSTKNMSTEISLMLLKNQDSKGYSLANLSKAYKEWERLTNQLTTNQVKNLLKNRFILDLDPRQQEYEYFLGNIDQFIDLGPKGLYEPSKGHTIH